MIQGERADSIIVDDNVPGRSKMLYGIDWGWSGPSQFPSTDYGELERRAMPYGRVSGKIANRSNVGKTANFAAAYGATESDLLDTMTACKKCGQRHRWDESHTPLDCTYYTTTRAMNGKGLIPAPLHYLKILEYAGVEVVQAPLRSGFFPIKNGSTTRWTRKEVKNNSCRVGFYSEVWAVLACLDHLPTYYTSLRRPKPRGFAQTLRSWAEDVSQKQLIAGEHVLAGGEHREACRAFLRHAGGQASQSVERP